jgi:hypothetical protein
MGRLEDSRVKGFLRLLSVGIILGGLSQVGGQELQIGIIDLYGLTQVTPGQIREALLLEKAIPFPSRAMTSLRCSRSRSAGYRT